MRREDGYVTEMVISMKMTRRETEKKAQVMLDQQHQEPPEGKEHQSPRQQRNATEWRKLISYRTDRSSSVTLIPNRCIVSRWAMIS